MLTSFGKFTRKLRIDKGELLADMASKLNVSVTFLSNVEHGKKLPPQGWKNVLIQNYDLSGQTIDELDKCLFEARNHDNIDIKGMKEEDQQILLAFARKIDRIDKKKLAALLEEDDY